METDKTTTRRRLGGVVVSTKMDKTAVVRVDRATMNPKYLKRTVTSDKYKAHNEDNTAKVGDKVVIEETRPLSKTKRWRIVNAK